MDAADWYLNLSLRGAIARDNCKLGRHFVRELHPVIRRDAEPGELLFIAMEMGGDFESILEGSEPRTGVEYLSAANLYFWERRLPESIRKFGAECVPDKSRAIKAPAGFSGPIDHLFEPRLQSVFVRLDLSLPDEALHHDLQAFLTRERRALAAIGVEQPFAAALRTLGKHNKANLAKFASYRVLPFLDIEQWRIESGETIPDAAFARLLGITDEDLRETRKKARLVLDYFVLRGWLLAEARTAVRRTRVVLREI